jgi:hypothetical protein
LAGLAALALTCPGVAQVTVTTLGGGPTSTNLSPAGDTDGSTFYYSQFDGPMSLALDSQGILYVADRNNGKVRKVTYPGDQAQSLTSTLIGNLPNPVGLTIDRGDLLYVLCQGDGSITQYDLWGNRRRRIVTGLSGASAFAMDGSTNFYVTIASAGQVKKVTLAGTVTTWTNRFSQPSGIALMGNGLLAVSDTGAHAIRFLNPVLGTNVLTVGGHGAGFADGPAEYARFNSPAGLAASPSGNLVVADRLNHRVRMVATNGLTTTIYGIDSSLWGPNLPPQFYAGWWDGDATIAEAREPVSAVVNSAGLLFTTEAFYSLLRSAQGAPLAAGGGGGGGGGSSTNGVVVPTPWVNVLSGYYPMGQSIYVASSYPVYYTTDGTDPTVNSRQVALTNGNTGIILWNEPLRDLTSLRLIAVDGTNSSAVVSGASVAVNELGVTRDVVAGSGATVLVPLVLNLQSNNVVRTIQYRVEIRPQGSAPAVLPSFGARSISTNDFIQVVGASMAGTVGVYDTAPYNLPNPTNSGSTIPGGLAVFVIGTNANFYVNHFGTVAMLVVPIHPSARPGDTYSILVTNISATSDGQDTDVYIAPMPPRTLTIQNLPYLVGDSASSQWYSAGYFGDADLRNNDVNNAFYASLGIRTPFSYTDVFDAMDVFPPDDPAGNICGGDGQIRYLDWQYVLRRSLNLDPDNYQRTWAVGGYRVCQPATLGQTSTPRLKGASATAPATSWYRQAKLYSATLANTLPGWTYNVPVYVDVAPGCSLAGLSFRAVVNSDFGAPPVNAVALSGASGKPTPIVLSGSSANEKLCAWSLASSKFSPPLQGKSNLVAWVTMTVPLGAPVGSHYSLQFPVVDGAPNLTTQYEFESLAGSLWVNSAPLIPADPISDQWKTAFFGSPDNPLAAAGIDADGDGASNEEEYLAGTNPTDPHDRLRVLETRWSNAPVPGLAVKWLSAPGKRYLVERADQAEGGSWTVVASGLLGDGNLLTCVVPNASSRAQFFRLRVQP